MRFCSAVMWRSTLRPSTTCTHAAGHHLLARRGRPGGARVAHGAARDLAVFHRQHAGDGLERGALARAVGAQQGRAAALRHREVDALERQDHVGVQHLEVVHRQQRRRGGLAVSAGAAAAAFISPLHQLGHGHAGGHRGELAAHDLADVDARVPSGNGASTEKSMSPPVKPKKSLAGKGVQQGLVHQFSPVSLSPPCLRAAASTARTSTSAWPCPAPVNACQGAFRPCLATSRS
jgi:hypothetical protein